MLVKVSRNFPLRSYAVSELMQNVLATDVTDLIPAEIRDQVVKPECQLLTDNWEVYCYPRMKAAPSDKLLGRTKALPVGRSEIWIKPGLDLNVCRQTIVHEATHILVGYLEVLKDDWFDSVLFGTRESHGDLFGAVFRRVCDNLGLPEPKANGDMSTLYGTWN